MTYDNNTNPAVKTQETQVNTIKSRRLTRRDYGYPRKRVNYAEQVLYREIPVNGNGKVNAIEVDWHICPDCGASVDNGQECPHCSQPELCDDWFVIHHVGGTTSISRDGSVRFEEARG